MSDESFRPLFDDCGSINRSDSHFDFVSNTKRRCEPRGDTVARKGRRNRQAQTFLELTGFQLHDTLIKKY